MKRLMTYTTFILMSILISCSPAFAACFPRETVVERLGSRFNETLNYQGIAGNGVLIEFFVSPNGETWTMTVVNDDGSACLLLSGTDYLVIPNL